MTAIDPILEQLSESDCEALLLALVDRLNEHATKYPELRRDLLAAAAMIDYFTKHHDDFK